MNLKKMLILVFSIIGGVLIILLFVKIFNTKPEKKPNFFLDNKTDTTNVNHDTTIALPEYPISGSGIATIDEPKKAHLNPLKSHISVLGEGHTKFVLASDTSKFFYCADKKQKGSTAKTGNIENWYSMPDQDYLIYPNGYKEIKVSWWQ